MTNTLQRLAEAPEWILKFYDEVDSLQFKDGFNCFTSETEMIFGTAHVKGVEAMRELVIAVDSPLNIDHRVLEFWDGGDVKIIRGEAVSSRKDTPSQVVTLPFVNFFYLSESDPSKVRKLIAVAGPFDTHKLIG